VALGRPVDACVPLLVHGQPTGGLRVARPAAVQHVAWDEPHAVHLPLAVLAAVHRQGRPGLEDVGLHAVGLHPVRAVRPCPSSEVPNRSPSRRRPVSPGPGASTLGATCGSSTLITSVWSWPTVPGTRRRLIPQCCVGRRPRYACWGRPSYASSVSRSGPAAGAGGSRNPRLRAARRRGDRSRCRGAAPALGAGASRLPPIRCGRGVRGPVRPRHRGRRSARRAQWVAIDPHGVVGDAGYDVGPLLINPWERRPQELVGRRLDLLSDALGMPRTRLAASGLVRAVLAESVDGPGHRPAGRPRA